MKYLTGITFYKDLQKLVNLPEEGVHRVVLTVCNDEIVTLDLTMAASLNENNEEITTRYNLVAEQKPTKER